MTDSRVTPQAAAEEASAQVVRELFGYGCQHGRMAATLDYVPCGQCDDCTHDWSPEAKAILAAAAPLLCQPLQDEIDRLRAEVADLGEQIAQQIEQIPTGYGSGSRRDVNRVIGTAADIARAAAVPVGTGNPTQPRADDSARSVVPVSRVGGDDRG